MEKKRKYKKIPKLEWEKKAQEAGETSDAGKFNKVWGRPTKQVRSDFGEDLATALPGEESCRQKEQMGQSLHRAHDDFGHPWVSQSPRGLPRRCSATSFTFSKDHWLAC